VTVLIGTSGWHYAEWKGRFYPAETRPSEWLEYYSRRFRTVELNNAFYRLPTRDSFSTWAERVPEDFVISVKASRYLTHIRRLRDPADPVKRLLSAAESLEKALGPILLQLPPTLKSDPDALSDTLSAFPRRIKVAVEFRHPSWHEDRVRQVLEEHGAAWVMVDPSDRSRPHWRTTDWGYVRFHGGTGLPSSCYTRSPLETWAQRLGRIWSPRENLYCYFNNDGNGCAPRDARRFAAAVKRAGLHPSRVPGPRETPVVESPAIRTG
jgi:uncharacterized protein YecE (DUF72 family)